MDAAQKKLLQKFGTTSRGIRDWFQNCCGEQKARYYAWWNARHQSGATPERILDQLALELARTERVRQKELLELAQLPDHISTAVQENRLHRKWLRHFHLSKAGKLTRQCVRWCLLLILKVYGELLLACEQTQPESGLPGPQNAPEASQAQQPIPAKSCPMVGNR